MSHDEQEEISIIAKLALQLCHNTKRPDGDAPSNEALAAFYDGRVSQEEKNSIKKFIAHDPETYHRWLSLVETASAFEEPITNKKIDNEDFIHEQEINEPQFSKVNNIVSFLTGIKFKQWGGGFAIAACLAFLMVINYPSTHMRLYENLDDFYIEYESQLKPALPTRNALRFDLTSLSQEQKSMIEGVSSALLRLGSEFTVNGLNSDLLLQQGFTGESFKEQPRNKDLEAFYLAGYFFVILDIQCRSDLVKNDQKYSDQVSRLMQEMNALISHLPHDHIVLKFKDDTNDVCTFKNKLSTLLD